MKIKDVIETLNKGYHRPVSMPVWKWIIIYILFGISAFGYIFSVIGSSLFLIVGVFFQILALSVMSFWNTKRRKNTEQGHIYTCKYGKQ